MAKVKDLVCGMDIDHDSEFASTYEGKEYHFCSPACKKAFDKKPKAAIKHPGSGMPQSKQGFKIDFSIWWQRIILVTVLATIFSVAMFFIKEKPFSEESQLRFQQTDEDGHYDAPGAGEHEHEDEGAGVVEEVVEDDHGHEEDVEDDHEHN